MSNSEFVFFVKVKIVGPYTPPDNTVISDYTITNEISNITDWEQRVTGLNATPSPGSALLSFVKVVNTKEADSVVLKVTADTPSSKVAFNKAEKLAENLISILTLCIPGNRYYYKIEAVKMQPTTDFSIPFESAPSEDFFAMNYGKHNMPSSQASFIDAVGKTIKTSILLQNVFRSFSKALKAEIENGVGDEKSILAYYKCIELLSQNETRLDTTNIQQNKDYEKLAKDTLKEISKKTANTKKIINAVRKAGQRIREIENSIISRNIETVAKKIGFSEGGLEILKQIIKIRNKVIVHSEEDMTKVTKDFDMLHFRECAKAFIKIYLVYKYKINITELDRIPQQKEIAKTYRITYLNSVLNEKAKNRA